MAITPFGSFSVTFANLATKISGQAAAVKGYFDSIGNDIKTYINDTLLPALSSTADGSSGADQIGATSIPGLTGNTVQALLESVKIDVDGKVAKSLFTDQGDIIYASDSATPVKLAKGTAGQVLTMNSSATAPEWQTPADTSGKIDKSVLTTQGDIIYASAASTPARLGKGTIGQVLEMNSDATAPQWGNTLQEYLCWMNIRGVRRLV